MFNGYRISVWNDENVLGMDGGDSHTTKRMYFMSLNCLLKNSANGKFYLIYILYFLKSPVKKISMHIFESDHILLPLLLPFYFKARSFPPALFLPKHFPVGELAPTSVWSLHTAAE